MGKKMSLIDRIDSLMYEVLETDYRMDVTIKKVELVDTKFKGPEQLVMHSNKEGTDFNTIRVPIDEKFQLERPADSVFTGNIIPSRVDATVGVYGSVKPSSSRGIPLDVYREYPMRFAMSMHENFKIHYSQHEMFLDLIIANELDVINQLAEEGMVFEGERVWKQYSQSMQLYDHPRYQRKMSSRLPRNLGNKILEKAREKKQAELSYSPA